MRNRPHIIAAVVLATSFAQAHAVGGVACGGTRPGVVERGAEVLADGAGKAPGRAAGPVTLAIALEPGQRVFSLGRKFVFEGSLSLVMDGAELALGRDYLVDLRSGTVFLRKTFPLGSTIEARFRALPFALKEIYGGPWDPGRPGARGRAERRAGADDEAAGGSRRPGNPSLTVGGSKRLAFEFGTGRDITVSQSLDLNITGRVGRDVQVKAVLSDRNLPLLPEGNTQTLEEIDEVYVKVTSPSLHATFGDYTLVGPPSEFGQLNRAVEGVEASAARGNEQISVATASPRGRFKSVEFMGEEGKQGAYYVTEPDGRAAAVVPGSEKVWLDGEPVRRGAAADYTIDYASGAITFTSARTITKDTRISVDYEYTRDEYRRSLYSVVGRSAAGPLGITGSYMVEKDDRNSPVSGSITDEDKSRFANAGDSFADGAVPDSSAGAYESGAIRPPSSHEVVDLGVSYSLWDALSFKSEVALSDMDLNTFSNRDDSDNKGSAYSLVAELVPRALKLSGARLGTVQAGASLRRTEPSFASMGRLSPAMDYDRWNVPPGAMGGGERRSELSVTYRPSSRVSVAADFGDLSMDEGGRSRVVTLSSSAAGARGYLVKWQRAEAQAAGPESALSRRERRMANLRWKVGPVASILEAETETRRGIEAGAGDGYRRLGGELKGAVGNVAASAALHVRDDYSGFGGARERGTRAVTQSYGFSYSRGAGMGLDGRYGLRTLSVDSTGARLNSYVAHFDGVGGMLDGAWGWRGSYEVTSTDEGPRTAVFVGPGKGHYDADGRYVGVGDYELGEGAAVGGLSSRVALSFNSEFDWSRSGSSGSPGGPAGFLSNVRWSGLYRLEEHTRAAVAAPSHILHPGSYMNPDDVIRGSSTTRADLELFPRGRIATPRLRYEVRRRLQSAGGESLTGSRLRLISLRLRTRALSRTTLEAEQVWGGTSSEGADTPSAPARHTAETSARVIFRPGPRTNLSLRSSYLADGSPAAGGGTRWEIEPSAGYSMAGVASVEARCKWARAHRSAGTSYDQLLGWLGDRVEYSLSGQVGLGAGLTLAGTMRATGTEWGDLSHYFKMEMRALF